MVRDAAWLFLANLVVYFPVLPFGYFFADDFQIGRLYGASGAVNWRALEEFLTCQSTFGFVYRPVGYLSIALDYAWWRSTAHGYFLTNLALHGSIAVLVYAAVRELRYGRAAAIVAALTMVLHPLHVEPIWWMVGRFDLLATAFGALAVWAYARWGNTRHPGLLVVVVVSYALAAFAKEAAIALPLALLVVGARAGWSRPIVRDPRHLAAMTVLAAVAAGVFLARRACLDRWIGTYPGGPSPASPRTVLAGVPRLVWFLASPSSWSADGSPIAWLAAGASLGALIYLCGSMSRWGRMLWPALTAVCLALPVLAIVSVVRAPDDLGRVFLLPSIGLALLLATRFQASELTEGGRRAWVALGLVMAGWLCLTAQAELEWMRRAAHTRRVLAAIEQAVRAQPSPHIVVAGLPEYFGAGNWALPLAAARPFIEVPAGTRVTAAGSDLAREGETRVLRWEQTTRSLVRPP